ncbi:HlyD family secretion protein [Echinicola shivajiensis]|uniref:HlyD family secretion protein n=1 Tax=Echinicola shivajiensis TaxID=1035916 RepID=UPI001FEAF99C|nr:HlyD family efflux transporter periplasmic adaptor subunit [Echinicola shivajiensis]
MKNINIIFTVILLMAISQACEKRTFDASGAFEAEETIISAEVSGKIMELKLEEGQELTQGQAIGYIDSTQLALQKKQIAAQIRAILAKKPNIPVQLASIQERLQAAKKEQNRIQNLIAEDAATAKQLDDINAEVLVLEKQFSAQKSSLNISSGGLDQEILPLQAQQQQIEDNLKKSLLINPIAGTVLVKYMEEYEMAVPGKPLYKIANLSTLILRVYITADQLAEIRLGQEVRVFTDNGKGEFKETQGTVSWISDKAEFTPKTIQTKAERANMVYAIKVKVPNTGQYKIGMYGEINFSEND